MRWLFLLLLLPTVAAQPQLVGAIPDLPGTAEGDEGFAIHSPTPWSGCSITDEETVWEMPPSPAGTTWFTGNATHWATYGGPPATPWPPGALRLGNSGDSLRLVGPGCNDAFAWGDAEVAGMEGSIRTTSRGLVYMRDHDGAYVDTNHWRDWATPRDHRIGESALAPARFTSDGATLYAAPDNAFEVLRDLMDGARERVHLHVYELRNQALADHLVAAAARGIDVQVLVEEQPVGQSLDERDETAMILQRLKDAGAGTYMAGNGRYAHHHLKVLVADDQVAVQTENWVASGVPQDPSWGNRGHGLVLRGAVADWMAQWMAADRAAWDTAPFELDTYAPGYVPVPRFAPPRGTHVAFPPTVIHGPVEVTVLVSPDATADPRNEASTRAAALATTRLLVQQLDLRTQASNMLGFASVDPLYAAVLASPAPDKRVMAAAPFRADDIGNRDVLAMLAAEGIAGREQEHLHAKAFVADDTLVIGSMNGNHASRSRNREVTVMVEDPVLADAFAATFERDWRGTRDWSVIGDDLGIPAPGPMLFGVLLLVAACFTGCRGSHSR